MTLRCRLPAVSEVHSWPMNAVDVQRCVAAAAASCSFCQAVVASSLQATPFDDAQGPAGLGDGNVSRPSDVPITAACSALPCCRKAMQ